MLLSYLLGLGSVLVIGLDDLQAFSNVNDSMMKPVRFSIVTSSVAFHK